MKESKHTPGPWRADWFGNGNHCEIIAGEEGTDTYRHITNELPLFDETGTARAKADIRLIVSAPDLLEALEQILQRFNVALMYDEERNKSVDAEDERICKLAERALNRAKGVAV